MKQSKRNYNQPEHLDRADIVKISDNFDIEEIQKDGICGTEWGGYIISDSDTITVGKIYIDKRTNVQWLARETGEFGTAAKRELSLRVLMEILDDVAVQRFSMSSTNVGNKFTIVTNIDRPITPGERITVDFNAGNTGGTTIVVDTDPTIYNIRKLDTNTGLYVELAAGDIEQSVTYSISFISLGFFVLNILQENKYLRKTGDTATDLKVEKSAVEPLDVLNRATGFTNVGAQIISGSNLNTYTTQGHYRCALNATAATLQNAPFGGSAFDLVVGGISDNGGACHQVAIHYATGDQAIRVKASEGGAFTPWTTTTKDVPGGFFTNRATIVPANTNLNSFITEGHFSGGDTTNVGTILNNPFPGSSFVLVNTGYAPGSSTMATQIYYKANALGVGNEMAIRTMVNGTWSSYNYTQFQITGGFTPNHGVDIPDNANLFLYTTNGKYRCGSNARAATLIGVPPFGGTQAFVLEVDSINPLIENDANKYITQRATSYYGQTQIRTLTTGIWSSWVQISTSPKIIPYGATTPQNANSFTEEGVYSFVGAPTGSSNFPEDYGVLHVTRTHSLTSTTHVLQTFRGLTNNMYMRSNGASGTWSAWTRLALTTDTDLKVNKAGDTMTGVLNMNVNSDIPMTLRTGAGKANYILARDSAGANDWYLGRGSSTSDNVTLNSYKNATSLTLGATNISANKDFYVGTDRVVKLSELTTTNNNVSGKVSKAGDIMTGGLTINAGGANLTINGKSGMDASYILSKNAAGQNSWFVGTGTAGDPSVAISSYIHGTQLSLQSDRIHLNKDAYVGTARLVKLPELTATNSSVSALTTRTTNLENSRALQTSLDATNGRVTTLERFTSAVTANHMAGIITSNVYRSGNTVFWFFDTGTALNGTKAQWEIIATIPVGFRPTTPYYLALSNGSASVIVQVDVAGQIALASPKTNTTSGGFRGTLSFPAQ